MLPSLHIEDFRCFRELTIERLGRVNLIVGKNNVGKTTLLDALRVHAAQEDALYEVQAMLDRRGEILRSRNRSNAPRRLVDWGRAFHKGSKSMLISLTPGDWFRLEFRLEQDKTASGAQRDSRIALYTADMFSPNEFYLPLANVSLDQQVDEPLPSAGKLLPYQYIPSSLLPAEQSSRLWDGIVLTEHEETCLQALRIIEPEIQRVALVDVLGADGSVERAPHVSRKAHSQPEPLRSLGEGMNRLFDITLGMVNARGGRLLIDEIENGLHYSIHEELWRYVFQIASMLDVQVFATTHSWGCIEAFQAAEREHPGQGILIRLERRGDETRAFLFGEDKLAVVAEQGVEVR